ncbi:MAG TPA: glycosyltransferase family A protein [Candidatus Acidoferrum sp.]|nr:glycosyltransferase family A protein [Candidatus Acidoferrum sp.]
MHVTIAIPTYKTRGSIFKLLDSLKKQSYKKFSILFVYKEWEGWKETAAKIKEYKGLDIDFARQDNGFFEEALNTIFRKADGDIVLHTDDDAFASRDWVKDHVALHSRDRNAGIATGVVDESRLSDGSELPPFTSFLYHQKWRMNKHTLIDKPIDDRFKDYGMYIGVSGLVVDTGRRHNMIKTFKQHGVNMSWKHGALHGFKFPGYAKSALRNEQGAALEVINRGFYPIRFNAGRVFHPVQESLSRGTSPLLVSTELIVGDVLLSYYMSLFYKIDLDVLRLRTRIDDFVTRLATQNRNKGYSIGYELASKAIRQKWKPKRVRETLIETLKNVG